MRAGFMDHASQFPSAHIHVFPAPLTTQASRCGRCSISTSSPLLQLRDLLPQAVSTAGAATTTTGAAATAATT